MKVDECTRKNIIPGTEDFWRDVSSWPEIHSIILYPAIDRTKGKSKRARLSCIQCLKYMLRCRILFGEKFQRVSISVRTENAEWLINKMELLMMGVSRS